MAQQPSFTQRKSSQALIVIDVCVMVWCNIFVSDLSTGRNFLFVPVPLYFKQWQEHRLLLARTWSIANTEAFVLRVYWKDYEIENLQKNRLMNTITHLETSFLPALLKCRFSPAQLPLYN